MSTTCFFAPLRSALGLACGLVVLHAVGTAIAAPHGTAPMEIPNPEPAADDLFGSSVSLSGQRFAVGAVYDGNGADIKYGSVFVYEYSNGAWGPPVKLGPTNPTPEDWFSGVALQGDELLVGASRKNNKVGAAFLFKRDPLNNAWQQVRMFEPPLPHITDCGSLSAIGCHLFGGDVALSGDTIAIAAHTEVNQTGAVYLYSRNLSGAWEPQDRLTALDAMEDSSFSNKIALQGDTLLVGANGYDVQPCDSHRHHRCDQGAAYVFERKGGKWKQTAKLMASDAALKDHFGYSVDLDGDYAIIGARLADPNSINGAGAAYVFHRGGDGEWQQRARLSASNATACVTVEGIEYCDQFGYSVAIRGGEVLIGRFPGNGATPSPAANGTAHRFRRNGEQWDEMEYFTPASGLAGDGFGVSLAFDERLMLVGAHSRDASPSVQAAGSVFLYARQPLDRIFSDGFDPPAP